MVEHVGLGGNVKDTFFIRFHLDQLFLDFLTVEFVKFFHVLFCDFDDLIVGVLHVAILHDDRNVLVGQLNLVEGELKLRTGQVFEGTRAAVGIFGISTDGLLANFGCLAVIIVIGAVVGVLVILVDQACCKAVGKRDELCIVPILGHQRPEGLLIAYIILEDAIDKAISFVVVVEKKILVVFVLGDEHLEETEAADDGIVAVAEISLGKIHVVEPPKIGIPIRLKVVGVGVFLVIAGHAMDEEVEHGGLILNKMRFWGFKKGDIRLCFSSLELFNGLEC